MKIAVRILSVFLLSWWSVEVCALERKPHPCPVSSKKDDHLAGHLEQLGCQRLPLGPVTEYFEPPTPRELWENHVKPYRPAVIRNALKGSPALDLWTEDAYLSHTYGDQEVLVEKKYEDRRSEPKRMEVKEFLQNYHKYNWYVVTILPNAMRQDIKVPRPLMCGTLRENLAELNLWIGTKGTRSMLHYDADNILHCVVTGLKDWILIHPENLPKLDMVINREGQNSGFSHLDVDKVDENINPEIWDVPWQYVTLKDGDCLYLPYQYLHQVRSYNRTISTTFLFYPDENFTDEDCENINYEDYQSLEDTYVYWTYEKGQETVDMGYMNPETIRMQIIKSMKSIGKEKTDGDEFLYLMLVLHGATEPGSGAVIFTFYKELDTDNDGFATISEVKNVDTEAIKQYCRDSESPHGPTKSAAPKDKRLSSKSPDFNPRFNNRHMDSHLASIFLNFVLRVKGENGQITYPDFKKYVEVDEGSIADAFILFDRNFDGIWTEKELQNATKKRLRDFSRMRYSLKGTTIRGGGIYESELEQNDVTYLKKLKEIPKELIVTSEMEENEETQVDKVAAQFKQIFAELHDNLAEGNTLGADTLKSAVEAIRKGEQDSPFNFKIFFKFIDRGSKGFVSREDAGFYALNAPIQWEISAGPEEHFKPCEFLAQLVLSMEMGEVFEKEWRNKQKFTEQHSDILKKTEL